MRIAVNCLQLILAAVIVFSEHVQYDNYMVWLVRPTSDTQLHLLQQWHTNDDVDFWNAPRTVGGYVRIMISPNAQADFAQFLSTQLIPHELIISNVERELQRERRDAITHRQRRQKRNAITNSTGIETDFNHYWRLDEMDQYIGELERLHPDLVSTEIVGYSFEGRPLRVVNISLLGRGHVNGSRPIVFIDAGIHAREWLAPHTALYILQQLIENRQSNRHILERIDVVVMPLVNPDGYVYSYNHTRLWRKTRRSNGLNANGVECFGTDGNRNYGFRWASAQQTNVTTCQSTYPGSEPFSEPETRAVRDIFQRYGTDIKMYISLHSYGSYVLYPWGYKRESVANWRLHQRIGHLFASKIYERHWKRYLVLNAAYGLYPANGGSDDYAISVGVQTAFTFELNGGGRNGFDMPAHRLQSELSEFWLGFERVLHYAGAHDWSAVMPVV